MGDNSFSRQGGTTIPKIVDPFSAKFKNMHVVYYEKNTGQFLTNLGSSNYLQALAKKYGTLFKETNLGAWQNIFARIPDPNDPIKYEGDRVNIGSTELIWKEKGGNFCFEHGLVAVTTTINIARELQRKNLTPANSEIKKAEVRLSGFHGGRRKDQSDNVELIVNNVPYKVAWGHPSIRSEEKITIPIDDSSIGLEES